MSLPYFNLYPKDFEADTSHLTLEEDGAYNRLLRLCWMTPGCSLPDDDAWIMRRMRVDAEAFERAVRPVLAEFFIRKAGRISNARMTKEHQKSDVAHHRRVSAGSAGGKAKALNMNNKELSNATAMLKQPEPEPEPEKEKRETDVSPKKTPRGSRLPSDWQLPKPWAEWAIGQGLSPDLVRREGDRFRDYWLGKSGKDATKVDWEATWRNWMRKRIDDLPKQPQKGSIHTDFWTGPLL